MIDVHFISTANGYKVTIALEEMEQPYRVVKYDMFEGDHLTPEFRRINPNNKLPAIVDHEPIGGGAPFSVIESGAILLYLAEKTGKLMPRDPRGRSLCQQWLIWQAANMGPMLGQAHHFIRYAPEGQDYGQKRYRDQAVRIFEVLEYRLREAPYLAGDDYSVADIMCWVWAAPMVKELIGLDTGGYEHTTKWFQAIAARPAVQRATSKEETATPAHYVQRRAVLTPAQWSNMFGDRMLDAARAN
ncbi:MAG: glutathione S-transferase N-terminal domain-containing protein [Caulobacterales bacterium]